MIIIIIFLFYFFITDSYEVYHPTNPIEVDCRARFRIEPGKNVHWPLLPNSYNIIKRYDKILDHFTFYAIAGNETNPPISSSRHRTRYRDQIAYATCKPGWIDYVWVSTGARKCGISTVLSELCLLDPELNSVNDKNQAIKEISTFEKNEEVEKVIKEIIDNYNAFIGLEMKAEPLDGAHAYFSAAIRMRYTKMIIQPYNARLKRCDKGFRRYDTELAKTKYNSRTGRIEDVEGSGNKAKWYFCKLKN